MAARRAPRQLRRALVLSGLVALVAAVTPVLLGALPSASGTIYSSQATIVPLAASAPRGVSVDGNGDVFVADSGNKRVLELEPGVTLPIVLPFSGLKGPEGVAVYSGNVYVVDNGGNGTGNVYELHNGTQSTLPFSGLNDPQGIAIDGSGDVFVADTGNNRVVELADGAASQTVLPSLGVSGQIVSVAVDSTGNVFAGVEAPSPNSAVVEIPASSPDTPQTVLSESAGSNLILNPYGLAAVADGSYDYIYVANLQNNNTPTDEVIEYSTETSSTKELLNSPDTSIDGLAIDGSGDVYISGANLFDDAAPVVVERPAAPPSNLVGIRSAGVHSALGVGVDGRGDVYTADTTNDEVVTAGAGTYELGLVFTDANTPQGVAVDSAGDVFLASSNNAVEEIPNGSSTADPLSFGTLDDPQGIAVDSSNDVFVADTGADEVLELAHGQSSATAPLTGLDDPTAVAVQGGNLFVTEGSADSVIEYNLGGQTQSTLSFSGLSDPDGVAVDVAGDVFVADSGNNRVVELPAGQSSQVTLDFTGLSDPNAVAVDGSGDVFVSSASDGVIELPVEGAPSTSTTAAPGSAGEGSSSSATTTISAMTAPIEETPPSISGSPRDGDRLRLRVGSWSPAGVATALQWKLCRTGGSNCRAISGADTDTLLLSSADVGSFVMATVTAGSGALVTSASTSEVGPVAKPAPPRLRKAPSLSGDVDVGASLTASTGSWKSPDVLSFRFAWELCSKRGRHCQTIDGATGQDYRLVHADLHRHVAVLVTAVDAEKQTATARSQLLGPVRGRHS